MSTQTETRDTLRVFYPPTEKTPAKRHEDDLLARIAELEALTDDLTTQLSDRTEELLDALHELEDRGTI